MEDGVAFLVGRETDDHLRLTVLKRFAQSADQWFDYGSLLCRIEVKARGMRADFEGTFRAEGFENLRYDLAQLDQAFRSGIVRFEPGYEKALTFDITVGEVGSIGISGVAIDGSVPSQELKFEFGVEDSLRAILASTGNLARAYPPSPSTQLPVRPRRTVSP
jgi:hypothetical protein